MQGYAGLTTDPRVARSLRFSPSEENGRSLDGYEFVKPARLHFARTARALTTDEAFCPNFQPRAHARLTGLTLPDVAANFHVAAPVGRKLSLRGSAAGQTTSGKLSRTRVFTRNLVHGNHLVTSTLRARVSIWLGEAKGRRAQYNALHFLIPRRKVTMRAWPVARSAAASLMLPYESIKALKSLKLVKV